MFTHVDAITFHGVQHDILYASNEQKQFRTLPDIILPIHFIESQKCFSLKIYDALRVALQGGKNFFKKIIILELKFSASRILSSFFNLFVDEINLS